MARFFESLGERGRVNERETLNDHPGPASQVAAIEETILSIEVSPAPLRDTEEFRRIKSRLKDAG